MSVLAWERQSRHKKKKRKSNNNRKQEGMERRQNRMWIAFEENNTFVTKYVQ